MQTLRITRWKTTSVFGEEHCYGSIGDEKVTRVLSSAGAGRLNRIGQINAGVGGYSEGDTTERFDSVDDLIKHAKKQFGDILVSPKNFIGTKNNDVVVVVGG